MKLKITVHGVAYEVDVEVLDIGKGFPSTANLQKAMPPSAKSNDKGGSSRTPQREVSSLPAAPTGSTEGVTSPIAGTVIELKCSIGDEVTKDQILVIMEAMKMKTAIAAPTSGRIKAVLVAVGDPVRENQMLIELE